MTWPRSHTQQSADVQPGPMTASTFEHQGARHCRVCEMPKMGPVPSRILRSDRGSVTHTEIRRLNWEKCTLSLESRRGHQEGRQPTALQSQCLKPTGKWCAQTPKGGRDEAPSGGTRSRTERTYVFARFNPAISPSARPAASHWTPTPPRIWETVGSNGTRIFEDFISVQALFLALTEKTWINTHSHRHTHSW